MLKDIAARSFLFSYDYGEDDDGGDVLGQTGVIIMIPLVIACCPSTLPVTLNAQHDPHIPFKILTFCVLPFNQTTAISANEGRF